MKYMLDTCTCVFIMNGNEQARIRYQAEQPHGLAVSAITLSELEFGVMNSRRREYNEQRLRAFLATVVIMPYENSAPLHYASIRRELQRRGEPIGPLDMLIAAHAKSVNLVLVTNNTREFARVDGLALEDWLA